MTGTQIKLVLVQEITKAQHVHLGVVPVKFCINQTPVPPTQSRFTIPIQQATQLPQSTIPGRKSQFSLLLEATQPSSLPDYSSIPPRQPRSQVLLPTPPTVS